ncbi:unnamed protein product [Psylliodes chrysocephalus]|uniref:DUF4371 domain-containing protein n=1 Tax=Psylliodes chrysocephalus TaxID=3402493 RepID=A0A9P0CRR0_9CUCU|nr:unnamed protein product [Psylliodes chrysocephala]
MAQLDSVYWLNIQRHNENVSKNRYILSKIINCIKFCGAFDLALRGHDESDSSENPEIFRGLINFSAELDQLKNYLVYKGTFKEIHNDLLQCMLDVCHEQIIEEINNFPFLAIMADETTDVAAKNSTGIFRYVRYGEPIERFWNYLIPEKCDSETLSKTILIVIDPLIQNSQNKLMAQNYDGAVVMSSQYTGVIALIKKVSFCSLCTLLYPSV